MKFQSRMPIVGPLLLVAFCVCAGASPDRPLGRSAENHIYAQRLVDELQARNPDLLAIAFHAVLPDTKDQVIIAYTGDKIGEIDPQDEVDLAKHGATMIVPGVKDGVSRYQVRSPLKDGFGRNLGLLVISYRRDDHKGEAQEVLARQYRLVAEIAQSLDNNDFLYQPYDHPMIKAATNKIYAQKLVNAAKAKRPEIIAVGIHAVRPGTNIQQIVANTVDNINSIDPGSEIDMAKRGMTSITPGVHDNVKRYQIISPLRDASGRIIGLLFVNYPRKTDGQELALSAEQDAIAAELSAQIPSLDALFQPAEL